MRALWWQPLSLCKLLFPHNSSFSRLFHPASSFSLLVCFLLTDFHAFPPCSFSVKNADRALLQLLGGQPLVCFRFFVCCSLQTHLRSQRDGSVDEDTCNLSSISGTHLVQEENSKLSFTRHGACRGTNTNKLFLKKVIWVIPILFKILWPFHTCT